MRFPRSAGIILHPSSLPSPFGMGDLGPSAGPLLDFLKATGQTIWQTLPLTPVGHGYSPYASYSAFAGNSYLISPERLVEKGLLTKKEIDEHRTPVRVKADFEQAIRIKDQLLPLAASRFYDSMDANAERELNQFAEENSHWLSDYCLFMVLLKKNGGESWNRWSSDLARRNPESLQQAESEHEQEIRYHSWLQFEFFNQWIELKNEANRQGVRMIGDLPIFVAHNSSDVWAHPEYYAVDEQGNREFVAGVPPDYFSETGQLWGNPVYNWEQLKKDGYSWWIDRLRHMFRTFDAVRVDHFRGFEAYWRVPAEEDTAIKGEWVKGPGTDLFTTIQKKLGNLPMIAEDLGFITPEVEELRDRFRFPGMKILQFAFDSGPENDFLPHNYTPNSVVYTGTHDNDTTLGWYRAAPKKEKALLATYTRSDSSEPHWTLIRLAMLSVADQAVIQLQDYMGLDGEHRMNTPATVGNNWQWRYTPEMLNEIDTDRIKTLVHLGNRNVIKR